MKKLYQVKIFLALLAICTFSSVNAAEILNFGKGQFEFKNWSGPALPVWYYYPDTVDANSNILIVMHGSLRDAEKYRDQWINAAKQTNSILIVPEFSKKNFPKARAYNLGGVTNRFKFKRNKKKWTFSAIEPLFDDVVLRTNSLQESYIIYGHSAGSQFVHRFLFFVPDARVKKAIAANAGWYAIPTKWTKYPFGIGSTTINKKSMKKAFNSELVILLGEKDNNPLHKYLNRSVKATRQGPHRLARGKYFYAYCKKKAKRLKTSFNWSIEIVEGVDHNNSKMIQGAIPYILEIAQVPIQTDKVSLNEI